LHLSEPAVIAQTYAQAFQTSQCCQLVAVADVPAKMRLSHLPSRSGAKSFSDYKTLAENSEIDAVIISTPPNSHPNRDIFYESRVNVCAKKPLCPVRCRSKTDDRNGRNERVLFSQWRPVSLLRRRRPRPKRFWHPGFRRDCFNFENAFTAKVDMSKRWNSDKSMPAAAF